MIISPKPFAPSDANVRARKGRANVNEIDDKTLGYEQAGVFRRLSAIRQFIAGL